MSHYAEEKVNAYSPDYQYAPAASKLSGGGYVVVWTSRDQDGSGDGIYAQRHDASGVPVGPEFRVNTTTAGAQLEPQVAGLSDGSFAVVWTDQGGADGMAGPRTAAAILAFQKGVGLPESGESRARPGLSGAALSDGIGLA